MYFSVLYKNDKLEKIRLFRSLYDYSYYRTSAGLWCHLEKKKYKIEMTLEDACAITVDGLKGAISPHSVSEMMAEDKNGTKIKFAQKSSSVETTTVPHMNFLLSEPVDEIPKGYPKRPYILFYETGQLKNDSVKCYAFPTLEMAYQAMMEEYDRVKEELRNEKGTSYFMTPINESESRIQNGGVVAQITRNSDEEAQPYTYKFFIYNTRIRGVTPITFYKKIKAKIYRLRKKYKKSR